MTVEICESVSLNGKKTFTSPQIHSNPLLNSIIKIYDNHTFIINLEKLSQFRTYSYFKIQKEIENNFSEFLKNNNLQSEIIVSIKDRSKAFAFLSNKDAFIYFLNYSERVVKRDWNNIRRSILSENINLKLERAFVVPVEDKYMSNVLKCKDLSEEITESDLFNLFSPFADDSTTLQKRQIKGVDVLKPYPFISIDENRVAFIVFNPERADAQFALIFNKFVTISLEDKNINLEFNHSFRTERDIITEIRRRQLKKK